MGQANAQLSTLKAIVDGIEDVIYISDPDSYELLHVNQTFMSIWGSDAIGKKCYKVIQDRDEPCEFCTNQKIFGEHLGRAYVWEFQNLVTKNWYRCSDKAIQWIDGRMVRFELAADITEQKLAEQSLKKTRDNLESAMQQLEQSNQDLQQFAYVASHDLQEPLRMVSSFTQLLADRYRETLDEKANTWIHYAVDGANRMQSMIQDLLCFSRVNTHGIEFATVDVGQVVKTAQSNLTLQIRESGARIQVSDMPEVKGDAGQLTLLFQNLISNGIKFCRRTPPVIEIKAQEKDQEWVFSVQDNGIGIDPQYLEKIFVIFQRLHTREEFPGTGLGLAVCKRIVDRHRGRIWIDSQPDHGSVFHFTLPH